MPYRCSHVQVVQGGLATNINYQGTVCNLNNQGYVVWYECCKASQSIITESHVHHILLVKLSLIYTLDSTASHIYSYLFSFTSIFILGFFDRHTMSMHWIIPFRPPNGFHPLNALDWAHFLVHSSVSIQHRTPKSFPSRSHLVKTTSLHSRCNFLIIIATIRSIALMMARMMNII